MSKQAFKSVLLPVTLILLVLVMSAGSCDPGSSTSTPQGSGIESPKCVEQSTNTTVVNTQSHFKSNFVGLPVTPGFVSNGVFSNIYIWDPKVAVNWDGDLNSNLDSVKKFAVPSETSETLDRLTCDLVNSSYFDPLTQYGIAPPVFAGDESPVPECEKAIVANGDANGGVIQYLAIKDFVNCENDNASGPKTTQVNLFFGPGLTVANPLGQPVCPSQAAYHGWFPGTRNFTVIPTSNACNSDISRLAHSLSHEMVETLSDPAAAGWLHDGGNGRVGDSTYIAQEYNTGELGDICSSVGAHPTADVTFEDPNIQNDPLAVAPYWSNADNTCVPSAIMNVTLWKWTGTAGLTRLTGGKDGNHTIGEYVIFPPSLANKQVLALEIEITTGSDNLDGGSSKNADVVLNLASGDVTTPDINEDSEWAKNSLHTAFLEFPRGMTMDKFNTIKGSKGFTIVTNFPGGLFPENWDIFNVTLKAAIVNGPTMTFSGQPHISILAPNNGAVFAMAQQFQLSAMATSSTLQPLPDADVTWKANSTLLGTGKFLTTALNTPGTYTITATANDSGDTASSSVTVSVVKEPTPTPPAIPTVQILAPTQGQYFTSYGSSFSVTLASSASAGVVKYQWSDSLGMLSDTNANDTVTLTPTQQQVPPCGKANDSITVKVTDNHGQIASASVPITIQQMCIN